jgi:hypothetical protein
MKGEVSLIWLGAAHDSRNTLGRLVETGLLSLIPIASRRIIPAANCSCSYIGNMGTARREPISLGASKSTTARAVARIWKFFRERRTPKTFNEAT